MIHTRHGIFITVLVPVIINGPGMNKVCGGPALKYLPRLKPLMKTMPLCHSVMSSQVS